MMVQIIRTMVNVNCNTTNAFLGLINAFALLNVPFNTLTGWKEDKKKAG